jgi:hypothetical protein
MISIILPNGSKIYQKQLGDYSNSKIKYNFKFNSIPKAGIMQEIRKYFKAKHYHQNKARFKNLSKISFNYTLLKYISGFISADMTIIAVGSHALSQKCPKNQHHVKHKPFYRQINLLDYIFGAQTYLKEVNTKFIDRFRPVPAVEFEDFCLEANLKEDWIYFQEVLAFQGQFRHLLLLNSFAYWDNVEMELRKEGFHPKGFSVKELVKWDLLRHSSNIRFTTTFNDLFRSMNKNGLMGVFNNPENVPEPYHFSHYYKYLKPEHFQTFFLQLIEECIQYGIIIPRLALGDGVFISSWAGNFTKDKNGNPTDPDASITLHDKKFYGKGFTTIAYYAWCGTRWLPVYYKTFTGSVSETKVYREVVDEFLATLNYDWKAISYDKAGHSIDNRKFNHDHNIISVIPAKKNITYDVLIDVGKDRYFCESDIPFGMSINKLGRLFDHRSQEESGFSALGPTYNMKEMNRMGLDAASIQMAKYFILQLLHALTAYKVNRSDLIMSSKAFTLVNL